MEKMPLWGIGPQFAILIIIYSIMITIFHWITKPLFTIVLTSPLTFGIIGIVLLTVGIIFTKVAVKRIIESHNQDVLCRQGVYRLCRHPIYASWIFFNVPGLILILQLIPFFRSWLIFTIPVVTYIAFITVIKKEEEYLLKRFEDDYKRYKQEVNLVFPNFLNLLN